MFGTNANIINIPSLTPTKVEKPKPKILPDYIPLTKKNERSKQPPGFEVELCPHQLACISAMEKMDARCGYSREENGYYIRVYSNCAILGDRPGYGKTFTMLGFLALNKGIPEKRVGEIICHSDRCGSMSKMKKSDTKIDKKTMLTNLIIVPNKILTQWTGEINRTNLKYQLIGPRYSFKDKIPFKKIDIILCAGSKIGEFSNHYDYIWNRVIVDEPDAIKVKVGLTLKYRFLWYITATYHNFTTYYGRISGPIRWNFTKNLDPEHLGHLIVKCRKKFLDSSYFLDAFTRNYIECYTPFVVNHMQGILGEELIEMLYANNIEGVIQKLGGTKDTKESIFALVTKRYKDEIQRLTSLKIHYATLTYLPQKKVEDEIEKFDMIIKECKEKIEAIEERMNIANSKCNICYDKIVSPVLLKCCCNSFCGDCVAMWFETKGIEICPLCHSKINIKIDMVYLKESEEVEDESEEIKEENGNDVPSGLPKERALVHLITHKKKSRFLVFSYYYESFDNIEKHLKKEGIKYGVLKGHESTVNEFLNKFRDGEIRVLLLNIQHLGHGVNIQAATDIVIFHEIKAPLEKQVIGRAQRMGRDENKQLIVHYLCCKGEWLKRK